MMDNEQMEFPRGSKVTVGRAERRATIIYTPLANALEQALESFTVEFGRRPEMDKLLFRGFYTKTECIVEICEVPS